MKDELELIEQGYLLEALSERGFCDLLYVAKKRAKGEQVSQYVIDDTLCAFPLPWCRGDSRYKIFDRLVESAIAKDKFERRIETIRRQAADARWR